MESMVLEAKKEVFNAAQAMARKSLVAGSSGNVSARVRDSDLVVITPTSIEYDLMLFEDICVINTAAEQVEGRYKPSIEIGMHLAIYEARPDVGGIVHTHQPMATAVAVAGKTIPPIIEEQAFKLLGAVELAEYAVPGTEELARSVVRALGERNACLLPHHGAVAVGPRTRDALQNAEIVERTANIFLLCQLLGGPRILPFMEEEWGGGPEEDEEEVDAEFEPEEDEGEEA